MQGQNATYVTTQLVTAPTSAALTSLGNVKDDLDIKAGDTSNDARLTRYINEESAGIARECNRIFGLATWQDTVRLSRGVLGEGVRVNNNPLTLAKWPLSGAPVNFVGNLNGTRLVTGIASTAGLVQGMPVAGTGIQAGCTLASVQPSSVTLSLAATATQAAVQLSAGMSVVETISGVDNLRLYGTDYEIDTGSLLPGDEGTSRLYRLTDYGHPRAWEGEKVTILYQAGYALPGQRCPPGAAQLPADLSAACARLVVMRYRTRGRDPTVMERAQQNLVGSERYWVGGTPGQKGAYPSEIQSVLDRYRTPVIA